MFTKHLSKHLPAHLFLLVLAACGGDDGSSGTPVDAGNGSGSGSGSGTDAPPAIDAAVTRDPALDGDATFTSETTTITGATQGRQLDATVFTPSTPGPRPLVVISPGFQLARTQYTSYAEHLATWGFAVVLVDYAGSFDSHTALAGDVPKVIDWALAETALAVDPQRIALAGHSLGGKVSMLAAANDSRVKAVVGWDPVDAGNPSVTPERMGAQTAKIAVVGETTNGTTTSVFGQACAPTAQNFQAYYAAAPSPALAITVNGADHMDWVDDPSCFACGFCDPGTADAALARTITRRVDVAWLRRHLLDDTAMDAWLDAPPEVASGGAQVARK